MLPWQTTPIGNSGAGAARVACLTGGRCPAFPGDHYPSKVLPAETKHFSISQGTSAAPLVPSTFCRKSTVSPQPRFWVWMWLPSPGLQPLGCWLRVAHEVAPQEDSTQAVEPQSGQLFPVGTNLASSDRGEKKEGFCKSKFSVFH